MNTGQRPPGKYTEAITRGQSPPAAQATAGAAPAEEEERVEAKCFGYSLGNRHAIMLELRQVRGDRVAFGYSYLVSIAFDGGGTIELQFTGRKVVVRGNTLLPLFQRLVVHKVSYIQAVEPMHGAALEAGETVVDSIEVTDD